MLHLIERHAAIFKDWRVVRYEQEGNSYILLISATLRDDSRLELKDLQFQDGSRSYAYQWMEADNSLRRRWDNAPHWPGVATAPHHLHLPNQDRPAPSTITSIEELLVFLDSWFHAGEPTL